LQADGQPARRSARLPLCWSVGLSVCRSAGLSVCRAVGMSVCPSVGLLGCWSACRSVCRSACLPVSRHNERPVGLSVCFVGLAVSVRGGQRATDTRKGLSGRRLAVRPWRRRGLEDSEINDLSESGRGLGEGRPDPGNLALEAPRPGGARNQRSERVWAGTRAGSPRYRKSDPGGAEARRRLRSTIRASLGRDSGQ